MDFSNINFKSLDSLNSAFYGCTSLVSIGLNNVNAPSLTDANHMFNSCSSLQSIDFSTFKVQKLIVMLVRFFQIVLLLNL